MNKAVRFLKEVSSEMKKVTWPNRSELIGSTLVVITLVMFVAFYVGFVDFLLSSVINMVM
jgi:preprotein translocase subunit SecE